MRSRLALALVLAVVCLSIAAPTRAETGATSAAAGWNGTAPLKGGRAEICQPGPGLASTLLVPYFEVDLNNANGLTTLISVNNGLSDGALTRLVVWTDWGIPTMAFDIYLAGFDVQTINVRHLFNGVVPSTGEGVNLGAWAFCGTWPPNYTNPALTAGEIQQLVTAHTGQPGHIDGLCYGADYGDGIARGFITVDVVDECSDVEGYEPTYTPANTSYPYFAEGGSSSGIGIVDNRLWGDVIYVDFVNNSAQGSEAVAIWADPDEFTSTNTYTFYGRHSGDDGRDERVPLPWRWDQRFLNGGPFAGGADLIVFQQPDDSSVSPVSCGNHPPWWPLTTGVYTLDEEAGNFESHANDIFGLVTQRVPITTIGPAVDFGWIQIESDMRSMWVQPSLSGLGKFSAGFNGFPVEFLCDETP